MNRSLLERWLPLWLCLGCLVAYFWPALFPDTPDPFAATKWTTGYLIGLIMFAIGGLLPPDELREVWRHWPAVLAGTALQYTSMPLLAFAAAWLVPLPEDVRVGVIIVGCVPGAMASNVLTLIARGNVSYSISLTTVATLLSPLVVPLTLYLALRATVAVPVLATFLNLLCTVVLPLAGGFLLCRLSRFAAGWMSAWGPAVANLAILWLIALVVGVNRSTLGGATADMVGLLLLINMLGYTAGYAGGVCLRLPEGHRRALTIEIGMQNAGLGTHLALNILGRPAAAVAPALYTFGCMLTGTLLAHWWASRQLEHRAEP